MSADLKTRDQEIKDIATRQSGLVCYSYIKFFDWEFDELRSALHLTSLVWSHSHTIWNFWLCGLLTIYERCYIYEREGC